MKLLSNEVAVETKTWLAWWCIVMWTAAAVTSGPIGIWLAIGGVSILLGASLVLFDRVNVTKLLRPSLSLVIVGLILGGLMSAATYLLYPILTRLLPFIAEGTALLYSVFRGPSPTLALFTLLPVVLFEELIWRGAVQSVFSRRVGLVVGVLFSALAYALVLAPLGSLVLVLVAFACGLVWGALRAVTQSLVPPLVAHLLWDLLVLIWMPLDAK
jgi:uncharacterized protein